MEDMDEYMRCLDEIGKCNHILALDELTDRNTESELKREESKVDDHVQEAQPGAGVPKDVYEAEGSNVSVTNFLKDTDEP